MGNTPKTQTIYKCKLSVNQQPEAEATRSIIPASFISIGFIHLHLESLDNHTGTSSRITNLMCICHYPNPALQIPRAPGILDLTQGMASPSTSCLLKAMVLQHTKQRGSRLLFWAWFNHSRPGVTERELPIIHLEVWLGVINFLI